MDTAKLAELIKSWKDSIPSKQQLETFKSKRSFDSEAHSKIKDNKT